MNIPARILIAATTLCLAGPATAQTAGSGAPVRLLVPVLGGEFIDDVARIIAAPLAKSGRTYSVENRPGDYTHFAAGVTARARPDGQTVLFAPVTIYAAAMPQFPDLAYDLATDFTPVTLLANAPYVLLAHASLRIKSVQELIALAKARPREIKWGTHGNTSMSRLQMEMFKQLSGINVDSTPSDSRQVGIAEMMSGNTAALFDSLDTVLPHIKAGRVQVLATAGAKRSPALPEVRTVAEAGVPGFEADHWYGILAPEGVNAAAVKTLHEDFARAVGTADVKQRLLAVGIEARGDGPAELAKAIRTDLTRWAEVIRRAGMAIK